MICTMIAPKNAKANPINLSGVNSIVKDVIIAHGETTNNNSFDRTLLSFVVRVLVLTSKNPKKITINN